MTELYLGKFALSHHFKVSIFFLSFQGDNGIGEKGSLALIQQLVDRSLAGMPLLSVYGLDHSLYTDLLSLDEAFKDRNLNETVAFMVERRKAVSPQFPIPEYFHLLSCIIRKGSIDVKSSKLLLIGDSGAGKTTLVRRLRDDNFLAERFATDGIELSEIKIDDVNFKVLDFAGQKVSPHISDCHRCPLLLFPYC